MTGSVTSKAGSVVLKLGDYECPSQYAGAFTPLEFEELVHFFQKVDEVIRSKNPTETSHACAFSEN
jgi:hypothetical protein